MNDRLREALVEIKTLCDLDADEAAEKHGSRDRILLAVIPGIVDDALAASDPAPAPVAPEGLRPPLGILYEAARHAHSAQRQVHDAAGLTTDESHGHPGRFETCPAPVCDERRRAASLLAAPVAQDSRDPLRDLVLAALDSEDEIAHGEAVRGGNAADPRSREGVGRCAYCDGPWPCRTQRGIDRLRAAIEGVSRDH